MEPMKRVGCVEILGYPILALVVLAIIPVMLVWIVMELSMEVWIIRCDSWSCRFWRLEGTTAWTERAVPLDAKTRGRHEICPHCSRHGK